MHEISVKAEEIFRIFGFPVTNTLLMSWIVVGTLGFFAIFLRNNMRLIPGFFQNVIEGIGEALLNVMSEVLNSRKEAERFFPLIATIFFFILFNNWFGLIPLVGAVGIHEAHDGKSLFIPLFRSAGSDLNFTLALALISVFIIHIFGILSIGIFRHASKFFNISSPINFFVGILEFVGEIAKIVSFSFRLFGNIFAGEVLLMVIAFLLPFFVPVPFLILEVFVGFIQALVFAMLTLVFLATAVRYEH
jgi:F-type H+-transporting ATPase subunit a